MNLIKLKQPFRYLLVGVLCQLSDYISTIILFNIGISLFISNSIGYLLGSILSYVGHTKFTFQKKSKRLSSKKQISLFVSACCLGIIAGYLVIKILTLFEIEIALAKLMQLFLIALVQYLFNSKLTYKN